MIWWRCAAAPDHAWRAKPNNRTRGAGCPYCANKKVSSNNNLLARFARVAAEWHPLKNGRLTAAEVVATSSRVCWWLCSALHEWRASVRDRTRSLTACPYCTGKRPSAKHSLASDHPSVAREWHLSRNGALRPEDVTSGSARVVWWQCPAFPEHCWRANVNNRVRRASGCPRCARRRHTKREPLAKP
jgi:hypothetical protein